MKKRTLKFHGTTQRTSKLTPGMQRIKTFLDALPIDVAYDVRTLAAEVNLSLDHVQSRICTLGDEYRYKDKTAYIYANPKTIKLKKEGAYDG